MSLVGFRVLGFVGDLAVDHSIDDSLSLSLSERAQHAMCEVSEVRMLSTQVDVAYGLGHSECQRHIGLAVNWAEAFVCTAAA